MGKMLDKKSRKHSTNAVINFLSRVEQINRFDVIVVRQNKEYFVCNNIRIAFTPTIYPHEEKSYIITIIWGDDFENIEYAGMIPHEFRSYFDMMYCMGKGPQPILDFRNSWHESIHIIILEHSDNAKQTEMIKQYVE